ncbi:hypothetical protein RIF29_29549 [Crotalaria pallida]|uniref:Uncharacterized protein n=1 Tax=Crotalaria pallida TaxID=3830 RepID=A0AAN9EGX3_CROPI
MDKFVEDPVVNLDDDNSTSDESGGEEHDELGDKNGPAESDYISSMGSKQEDSDFNKVACLGAVVAAHTRLGEIAASKRDFFKGISDDLFKLVNKYENLAGTYTIHTSSVQDIGDPTMVKTKGAPKKRKDSKKRRRCSHCNNVGHTISTCPKRLCENDQYTKDDNLAPSNSLASDSEHDNYKEGSQHDEDKLQPSMPKNQSKTVDDKGLSPFLPYVGYPFFNQNLHHHPVYQQFSQVRRMSINNYSTFTYPKAKLRLPA